MIKQIDLRARLEYARTHTLAQHCRILLRTKGWRNMSFAEHRVCSHALGPNLDGGRWSVPSNVVPFVWHRRNDGRRKPLDVP